MADWEKTASFKLVSQTGSTQTSFHWFMVVHGQDVKSIETKLEMGSIEFKLVYLFGYKGIIIK